MIQGLWQVGRLEGGKVRVTVAPSLELTSGQAEEFARALLLTAGYHVALAEACKRVLRAAQAYGRAAGGVSSRDLLIGGRAREPFDELHRACLDLQRLGDPP